MKLKSQNNFHILPGGKLQGSFQLPGDKSISHRALFLSALAKGETVIEGFLESDDTFATISALQHLGVHVQLLEKNKALVHGVGLHGLKSPTAPLNLFNSGTAVRLLAGILSSQHFDSELTGDQSLRQRPMQRIVDPLRRMGAVLHASEDNFLPLTIMGGNTLRAIHYLMPIPSAQVKSCLLFAGLYAEGTTSVQEIAITRDHTERLLTLFGCPVIRNDLMITMKSCALISPEKISVPGDFSSAAFFIVAATIAPGSDIILENVGINRTRTGLLNILKLMGANIEILDESILGNEPIASIRVKSASLKGVYIPEDQVSLAIDEFPAILIAAACAEGVTLLKGANELRVKESDRLKAMWKGLNQVGIQTQLLEDGIIVQGGVISGGEVDSFNDHRIAMAFAIAGIRARGPITVKNCVNVCTSFPNFTNLANQMGLTIEENIHV